MKYEAGHLGHHAALVPRPAVVADDGRVDEREVLPEAGAPHDVGHVEDGAVVEQRQAVRRAGGAGVGVVHAGGGEVAQLDPHQRGAALADLGLHPTPDRRAHA